VPKRQQPAQPAALDDSRPVPLALRAGVVLVALAGLFSAAVLAVGHVLDLPVPCGGSRGCATVAAHPSSKFLGIPIAFFGMAAYLAHLVLTGRPAVGRRARVAALALAAAGTLISAGLLIYSQAVIRAACPWCIASGFAMAGLLVLDVVLLRPVGTIAGLRPGLVWTLAIVTFAAIGVQAGRMEKASFAPPVSADRLARVGFADFIDPTKSLGPADAAVTVIVFADFWCPACRGAMASLQRYQSANAADVRIVYRHQPLWQIRGHETSKAAAALSEMAGEQGKFWAFSDAVHAFPRQLTREQYLELMQRLGFDPATIEPRLGNATDPAIVAVQRDIDLADRLGIHATPTFVVKVGAYPPVAATQRGLTRLLNSPAVMSILTARAAARAAAK
jgi:uncharacterized membrane protein/thiol-disulfide isomerase/thioredoxin